MQRFMPLQKSMMNAKTAKASLQMVSQSSKVVSKSIVGSRTLPTKVFCSNEKVS